MTIIYGHGSLVLFQGVPLRNLDQLELFSPFSYNLHWWRGREVAWTLHSSLFRNSFHNTCIIMAQLVFCRFQSQPISPEV